MQFSRRKVLGIVAGGVATGLMNSQRLFAKDVQPVNLPKPSENQGGEKSSLQSALQLRKSTKSFETKPIPDQLLSDLLWAAFGVNRVKSGKRTAPSAFNRQEIDMYVITASDLYLYEAETHSLKHVMTKDLRELAGFQEYAKKAPINIVYVSDYSRMKDMPDEDKAILTAANTGFISQNVYLFCAINGLGTVVRGYIDKKALAKGMNLRENQKIFLAQTVGYAKS